MNMNCRVDKRTPQQLSAPLLPAWGSTPPPTAVPPTQLYLDFDGPYLHEYLADAKV
ncbi:hypothetical protein THAOC_34380, partial [Thalassiosira oceanica]